MAQNFNGPFHVPQQTRRNKLRVLSTATETPHHYQPSITSLQNLKDFNFRPVTEQDLSLSLPFHQINDQNYNAESALSGLLEKSDTAMRSSFPLGPFTGYSTILKSSRFLRPAQQILDDICGVNWERLELSLNCWSERDLVRENCGFGDSVEWGWRNSKLITMLDEVYQRYKLYCQQMQSVVASFQTVAGLGNAAPYISCAIRIVLNHFTCLKNALLDQIQAAGKASIDGSCKKSEKPSLNLGFTQHPVWRSQRGLPDRAVSVLKSWLFDHFLHPYPTDSQKQGLAERTGLSRTQVSNWFINARVRLWKPMVEEVHLLESQQAQAADPNAGISSDFHLGNLPRAIQPQKAKNIQAKRSRRGLLEISEQSYQDHINAAVDNLSCNYGTAGISGSNGISFPFSLHKNNGMDLSRPLKAGNHINLQMTNSMESASASASKAQNQHFG